MNHTTRTLTTLTALTLAGIALAPSAGTRCLARETSDPPSSA